MIILISKLVFWLAASMLVSGCGTGGTMNVENPVFKHVFADPAVIRVNDTYVAFATEDDWGDGQGTRHVPMITSRDLVNWEYAGEAFTIDSRPDWHPGAIWAPHAIELNGMYYLYYSMSLWGVESGPDGPAIGVARSCCPLGPYEDLGPILRSDEVGVQNSIDPMVFKAEGRLYLIWGSFSGIYGVELSEDGLNLVSEPIRIAGNAFEAPWVVERSGWYYIFLSLGTCCQGPFSTYRVAVGRSRSPLGPYVDKEGQDLLRGEGSLLLQGGDRLVGPGHNAVIQDGKGGDWLLYHVIDRFDAYLPNGATKRPLAIQRLDWKNGWPVTSIEPEKNLRKLPQF